MFSSTNRQIISSFVDRHNRRVVRWSRRQDTTQGEVIVDKHWMSRISHRSSEISLCLWHRTRWSPTIFNRRQWWHRRSWWKWRRQSIESTELPGLSLRRSKNKQCMCLSTSVIVWWNGVRGANQGIVVAGRQGQGSAFTTVVLSSKESSSIYHVQCMW